MRSRKGKKRDNLKIRPVGMGLQFTDEEADILHSSADAVKASFQYWARTRLLAAARVEFENGENSKRWRVYLDIVEARDGQNKDSVPVADTE